LTSDMTAEVSTGTTEVMEVMSLTMTVRIVVGAGTVPPATVVARSVDADGTEPGRLGSIGRAVLTSRTEVAVLIIPSTAEVITGIAGGSTDRLADTLMLTEGAETGCVPPTSSDVASPRTSDSAEVTSVTTEATSEATTLSKEVTGGAGDAVVGSGRPAPRSDVSGSTIEVTTPKSEVKADAGGAGNIVVAPGRPPPRSDVSESTIEVIAPRSEVNTLVADNGGSRSGTVKVGNTTVVPERPAPRSDVTESTIEVITLRSEVNTLVADNGCSRSGTVKVGNTTVVPERPAPRSDVIEFNTEVITLRSEVNTLVADNGGSRSGTDKDGNTTVVPGRPAPRSDVIESNTEVIKLRSEVNTLVADNGDPRSEVTEPTREVRSPTTDVATLSTDEINVGARIEVASVIAPSSDVKTLPIEVRRPVGSLGRLLTDGIDKSDVAGRGIGATTDGKLRDAEAEIDGKLTETDADADDLDVTVLRFELVFELLVFDDLVLLVLPVLLMFTGATVDFLSVEVDDVLVIFFDFDFEREDGDSDTFCEDDLCAEDVWLAVA